MSKSRRKTLSHLEVENFLNEISTKKITDNEVDNAQKPTNLKNINDVMKPNFLTTTKPVVPPDEAQLIRDYCKIKCSGKVHDMFQWEAMRNLSKSIHDKTTYKLMSERLMLPERFYHPIGSVENRREILLSLAPMLTDADTQRKQEVEACESFTKCRSSRVRARNTYEYIDMETTRAIDFVDYERRYIQYITEAKYNRQQNYALQLQPSSFVSFSSSQSIVVDDKENVPIQSLSTALSSVAKIAKKRKQTTTVFGNHDEQDIACVKSNGNRRETLSPGTVRKLLIEKVESVMSPTTDASQNFPTAPVEADLQTVVPNETDHDPSRPCMSPTVDIDIGSFDNEIVPSIHENIDHNGRKHTDRGNARRSTLSPSAAKLIAMEILSEESEVQSIDTKIQMGHNDFNTFASEVVVMNPEFGGADQIVHPDNHNSIHIEILETDRLNSCEDNPDVVIDQNISHFLAPMEIPHDSDETVISFAAEARDMVASSPTRRFFGRKSEGNIVNQGLKILDGSEMDLQAFELLESFVSGVLATAMEAESPHFFSPQKNSKLLQSSPQSSPICSSIIKLDPTTQSLSPLKEMVEDKSLPSEDSAEEINEEEWEKRASQRMRDRFATARWQYLWEIVSAQAANKAIHEARKKQKLSF